MNGNGLPAGRGEEPPADALEESGRTLRVLSPEAPSCGVGLRFRFRATPPEDCEIGPRFEVTCDRPAGHETPHAGPIVTQGAAQGVRVAFHETGDWSVIDRDRMGDVARAIAEAPVTMADFGAIFEAARRIALGEQEAE